MNKSIKLSEVVTGAFILLVLASAALSQENVRHVMDPTSTIYDKAFVSAMNNISYSVPEGAVLVVSAYAPQVAYLTGHAAKTPFDVASRQSLVQYMAERNYEYLVVFEGHADVDDSMLLFSSEGLKTLDSGFKQMQNYAAYSSKIRLYRREA